MINSLYVSCEYPKVIINRRYSKLNKDLRRLFSSYPDYYISVPCGRCALCKSRLANAWKVRLTYEFETTRTHHHKGKNVARVIFLTLTISDKYYTDDESIFTDWLVKFRDSYRKKYGRSPRYWAITDRGSQFGRLHLHMLLFDPRFYDKKTKEYTRDIFINELKTKHSFWWHYGFLDAQWVNSLSSVNYVVGYVTGANMYNEEPVKHGKPICEKALKYKPRIYVSKGLGAGVVDNKFALDVARRDYSTVSLYGFVYGLPRYLFTKVTDYLYNPFRVKTITDSVRVINQMRDDIIFHRQALNKAEEEDYLYRVGFDLDKIRYSYNSKDISNNLLQNIIKTNKQFLTPADVRPLPDVSLMEEAQPIFTLPVCDRFDTLPYSGLKRGYLGENDRWKGYEDFPF